MKFKNLRSVGLSSIFAMLITGCANYSASALSTLSTEALMQATLDGGNVLIAAKAFNKSDCKKYLDRDVISKGYQPIQIFIQNHSDKNYIFSLNRLSLPCAKAEQVAERVHTSTVGRATGYGAAALFTCGLFAIPAIVDGVGSAKANAALDCDFSDKTAGDQLIQKYSHLNKLIFVPVNAVQSTFELTLIEQDSKEPRQFTVSVSR